MKFLALVDGRISEVELPASGVPTYVAPELIYVVPQNGQALFSSPIDCEGLLVADGLLIEVV